MRNRYSGLSYYYDHLQYLKEFIFTRRLLEIFIEIFRNTKCSFIQLQFLQVKK